MTIPSQSWRGKRSAVIYLYCWVVSYFCLLQQDTQFTMPYCLLNSMMAVWDIREFISSGDFLPPNTINHTQWDDSCSEETECHIRLVTESGSNSWRNESICKRIAYATWILHLLPELCCEVIDPTVTNQFILTVLPSHYHQQWTTQCTRCMTLSLVRPNHWASDWITELCPVLHCE